MMRQSDLISSSSSSSSLLKSLPHRRLEYFLKSFNFYRILVLVWQIVKRFKLDGDISRIILCLLFQVKCGAMFYYYSQSLFNDKIITKPLANSMFLTNRGIFKTIDKDYNRFGTFTYYKDRDYSIIEKMMDESYRVDCGDANDQIVDLQCNDDMAIILTNDGKIYFNGSCRFDSNTIDHHQTSKKNGKFSNEILLDPISSLLTIDSTPSFPLPNIISFSCGELHIVCLSAEGDLYSKGYNTNGQLGKNSLLPYFSKASRIRFEKKAAFVLCEVNCTFVITNEGDLYTCGDNNNGQLGLFTISAREYRLNECNNYVYALTKVNFSNNDDDDDGDERKFKCHSIASSGYHLMVITRDGSLFACGRNDCNQLGFYKGLSLQFGMKKVKTVNNVCHVKCNKHSTIIITNDGSLYVSGAVNDHILDLRIITTFEKINLSYDIGKVLSIAYGEKRKIMKSTKGIFTINGCSLVDEILHFDH